MDRVHDIDDFNDREIRSVDQSPHLLGPGGSYAALVARPGRRTGRQTRVRDRGRKHRPGSGRYDSPGAGRRPRRPDRCFGDAGASSRSGDRDVVCNPGGVPGRAYPLGRLLSNAVSGRCNQRIICGLRRARSGRRDIDGSSGRFATARHGPPADSGPHVEECRRSNSQSRPPVPAAGRLSTLSVLQSQKCQAVSAAEFHGGQDRSPSSRDRLPLSLQVLRRRFDVQRPDPSAIARTARRSDDDFERHLRRNRDADLRQQLLRSRRDEPADS